MNRFIPPMFSSWRISFRMVSHDRANRLFFVDWLTLTLAGHSCIRFLSVRSARRGKIRRTEEGLGDLRR